MTSSSVVRVPNARFTGSGLETRRLTASVMTSHTVSTKVKSRDCVPSPCTCERLTVRRSVDERRYHRSVGMAGGLQRTEDVEEPERESRHVVGPLPCECVRLGRELGCGVRAHRPRREVLVLRELRIRPVHRRRRRNDHVRSAAASSRLQDVERAGGVRVVRGHGIGNRPRNRRPGSEVDHRVGAVDHRVEADGVEDRSLHEGDLDAVEVRPEAGREVVERHHLVDRRVVREVAAQVGADESGAAGDHDLHSRPLTRHQRLSASVVHPTPAALRRGSVAENRRPDPIRGSGRCRVRQRGRCNWFETICGFPEGVLGIWSTSMKLMSNGSAITSRSRCSICPVVAGAEAGPRDELHVDPGGDTLHDAELLDLVEELEDPGEGVDDQVSTRRRLDDVGVAADDPFQHGEAQLGSRRAAIPTQRDRRGSTAPAASHVHPAASRPPVPVRRRGRAGRLRPAAPPRRGG